MKIQQSANQGYLEAQYKVGYYNHGIVIGTDNEKALNLYKLAAKKGNSNA